MIVDDQTRGILGELELSEYETKAYLSIVEGGVMVARDISDRAGIPYAKVYQTLTGLIDKQLILGDEGRPKKFLPRPPKDAIRDRLQSLETTWQTYHQRRTSQLESILPELEDLYNESGTELEEEQGVWNISGSSNIANRIVKLVENTTDHILVITGSYSTFVSNFLKLLADKLPISLITNEEVEDKRFHRIHTVNQVGEAIIIIFDESAMISIAQIQRGKYSSGEFTAVLTQIHELVQSAVKTYKVMMR